MIICDGCGKTQGEVEFIFEIENAAKKTSKIHICDECVDLLCDGLVQHREMKNEPEEAR